MVFREALLVVVRFLEGKTILDELTVDANEVSNHSQRKSQKCSGEERDTVQEGLHELPRTAEE